MIVLESKRLYLREITQGDFSSLCRILQDKKVMYAYEYVFNEIEVQAWLDKQCVNYSLYGFGLWAVVLKEEEKMIGQCGLTYQKYKEKNVLELGYLFQEAYWHKGYAREVALGCKEYAFSTLGKEEVFSIIRDTNLPSQNVAKYIGMEARDTFVKMYRGKAMPHIVFSVKKL